MEQSRRQLAARLRFARLHWLAIVLSLVAPAAAVAQTQTPAPAGGPTVRLGGYVQFDSLSPLGERDEDDQTFRFRRVRLGLSGALVEHIDYSVTVEATNTPVLRDAYIVLTHVPAATVKLGQFMMPYGLEQFVISSNTAEFTERLLTPIVPGRDAGVMVTNLQPFGGWFTYAAGVTNGTGMNVRDNNDAKDAVVRLTATPPTLPGLQVSVNGARGDQPDGMRTRRGADVSFERRAYHVAAEYETQRWAGIGTRDGMYVLGSWRLYPETPHPSFHHLELGVRYGRLTGANPLEQWEVAANYYVLPTIRLMCDYIVRTDRAPGTAHSMLHARANIRF